MRFGKDNGNNQPWIHPVVSAEAQDTPGDRVGLSVGKRLVERPSSLLVDADKLLQRNRLRWSTILAAARWLVLQAELALFLGGLPRYFGLNSPALSLDHPALVRNRD
jgi:hypothetical protein